MGLKFLKSFKFNTISASKHALSYDYINNFEQLKQEIQTNTKPIMLDFTASWCENCKLLDELTFSDERIIQKCKITNLSKLM